MDSWLGNFCHCLCTNRRTTATEKCAVSLLLFLSAATTHDNHRNGTQPTHHPITTRLPPSVSLQHTIIHSHANTL